MTSNIAGTAASAAPGDGTRAGPTTTSRPDCAAQAPDDTAQEHAPRSRRRTVIAVVGAVLLSAGIWALIGQAASFSKVSAAIEHAHPLWLLLALAGVPVGYLGYALLYRSLAQVDGGPRPGLPTALKLTIAVFGASVIATSAGRLGSEYWSMRRMRERPAQAWSRVLAINIAGWAVLATLAFGGAVALTSGAGTVAPVGADLAWIVAVPVCVALALYVTAPSRRSLAEDRGGKIRRTIASGLRGITLLRLAAGAPRTRYRVLAGGLLHWGGELLTVWAALRAFDLSLGVAALIVAYATGYVATMLPLPAGGAGGVDAAGTYALHLLGVPLSVALLATLVQRALTYWLPLLVALVSARAIRRLSAELAAVPGPSAGGAS